MKKLFIIISLVFCAFLINAQDITLDYNQTYLLYNGTSSDVINTTDSIWTYEIWKKSDAPVNVYVDMLIDSTGGTANNVYVKLQHKRFVDLTYSTIDSVLWDGAASELISFSPSSKSYSFTALGLTDTTGLSGYPADSISTTGTITVTESDQNGLSGWFRILVEGQDNTLIAEIERLNLMFLKP